MPLAVWLLAGAVFVAHIVTNVVTPYGIHRDELLYVAMGERLQLWRMEFPPFIALLARGTRALFGESLLALRLGPAIAATTIVVCAAGIARTLGGRRAAQGVAALCVATGPMFLRPGALFQPVVFDQLWWTLALWALVVLRRRADPRWWLAVGAALGAGLLTKYTALFAGAAIGAAALLGRHRRELATRWPWSAFALALALGAPSVVGQLRLGFPIAWQMRELQAEQLERLSPWDFLAGQPELIGPTFVLAVAGLVYLVSGRDARVTRDAGVAVALAWLFLALGRGKSYYGAPVYPLLFAAGAVAVESIRRERVRRLAFTAGAVAAVGYGTLTLPLGLPFLPPEPTARYARAIGATAATRTNTGTTLPLPQDYADMLGWPEMVARTARVWRALPAERRARAVLLAGNYGEAGALDFYGPRHGLPRAVSAGGTTYWLFGPGELPGETVVALGVPLERLATRFARCAVADVAGTPWAVEEERRVPIVVCDGPRQSLQALWPALKPGERRP